MFTSIETYFVFVTTDFSVFYFVYLKKLIIVH